MIRPMIRILIKVRGMTLRITRMIHLKMASRTIIKTTNLTIIQKEMRMEVKVRIRTTVLKEIMVAIKTRR